MFFIIRFILSWIVWIIFADKRRWREIFPVSSLAALLGLITDDLFIHEYTLWDYHGAHTALQHIYDDLGIYTVVTYLFIQWLPKEKSFRKLFSYIFVWTLFAIGLEWSHLVFDKIEHHKWWTLWHSYMADWFLFWLFYKYYKIFKFKKLSETKYL